MHFAGEVGQFQPEATCAVTSETERGDLPGFFNGFSVGLYDVRIINANDTYVYV